MKIEIGKIYINKYTKSKVVVDEIDGSRIIMSEFGTGKMIVRSQRDFALKYKLADPPRKTR